jgi:hypothetical protein
MMIYNIIRGLLHGAIAGQTRESPGGTGIVERRTPSVVRHAVGRRANAQGRLTVGWQAVLLNQFHDILAGTSLRTAYDDVWQGYATAQDTAAHVAKSSGAGAERSRCYP